MAITPNDIGGTEDTAWRVITLALSIAPCLDHLPDNSTERKKALALLRGVIAELPKPGQARLRSRSRNGTSATVAGVESAFDRDTRDALRSLCGAAVTERGHAQAAFPSPTLGSIYPENPYP